MAHTMFFEEHLYAIELFNEVQQFLLVQRRLDHRPVHGLALHLTDKCLRQAAMVPEDSQALFDQV